MQRHSQRIRQEPIPWWQAEAPFALLALATLATPFVVRAQGGDWHFAIFAACVVAAIPGAAIESMIGLVRVALLLRHDDR